MRCSVEKNLPAPELPPQNSTLLEATLCNTVFGSSTEGWQVHNHGTNALTRLPSSVRHEKFIRDLSSRFESQTHDGPFEEAWLTGRSLLALCLLVYPENYPLTGIYLNCSLSKLTLRQATTL